MTEPPVPPSNFPPAGDYPPPPGNYPPPGNFPPPGPGYGPPPGWGPPPQGAYPPPGSYPPPPAGSYPPPPPGDGGYFPPPPGYGAPATGYSVGEGLTWAWQKFIKNAAPLVVATLVFWLIGLLLSWVSQTVLQAVSPETFTAFDTADGVFETATPTLTGVGLAVTILSTIVQILVKGGIASAGYGGLLDIANGQPVSIGSFFRPRNVVAVIVASLIVDILALVGLFACILPGLAVLVFTWFSTVAIVDRNLSPIDGIRTSIDIVKKNFGSVLLAFLTFVLLHIVGFALCGVGLLVTIPVAYLFLVYSYRRLSGGSVAPATA